MHFQLTPEAFEILTLEQRDALMEMSLGYTKEIRVMRDFSLPTGYVYFIRYPSGNFQALHGGISPEGDVST